MKEPFAREYIPCNELDKVLVQGDASVCVEGGTEGGRDEVRGDDLVFGVAEDSLETRSLRGSLHRSLDLVVGRLQADIPL